MRESVKDLVVAPISASDANMFVRREHYSHRVVNNSCLHFGVFNGGLLSGVMSFGPPMTKRLVLGLVRDTKWGGLLELNRMAFADALPKNSESRALSVAFKLIKKRYPWIDWVISSADACQCGDGAIYRASGFVLTGIKKNRSILQMPSGETISATSLCHLTPTVLSLAKSIGIPPGVRPTPAEFVRHGAQWIPGYMLRYIRFLNPKARERLTVPEIPFSKLDEIGARMYKGVRAFKVGDGGGHPLGGGATPT